MTIIVAGASEKKEQGYVVRFENGASMMIKSASISAAPGDAILAVLGTLPPGTDPAKIVQPAVVQLMSNVCAVCAKRFGKSEFIEFQPANGTASVVCLGCAGSICEACVKAAGVEESASPVN